MKAWYFIVRLYWMHSFVRWGLLLFLFHFSVLILRQGFPVWLYPSWNDVCRPGWPWTHSDLPASVFWVLALKAYAPNSGLNAYLNCRIFNSQIFGYNPAVRWVLSSFFVLFHSLGFQYNVIKEQWDETPLHFHNLSWKAANSPLLMNVSPEFLCSYLNTGFYPLDSVAIVNIFFMLLQIYGSN